MKSIRRHGVIATPEPTAEAPRPAGHTRFVDAVLADEAPASDERFDREMRARIAVELAADPSLSDDDAYTLALIHVCMGGDGRGGPTKPVRHRPMIDGQPKM